MRASADACLCAGSRLLRSQKCLRTSSSWFPGVVAWGSSRAGLEVMAIAGRSRRGEAVDGGESRGVRAFRGRRSQARRPRDAAGFSGRESRRGKSGGSDGWGQGPAVGGRSCRERSGPPCCAGRRFPCPPFTARRPRPAAPGPARRNRTALQVGPTSAAQFPPSLRVSQHRQSGRIIRALATPAPASSLLGTDQSTPEMASLALTHFAVPSAATTARRGRAAARARVARAIEQVSDAPAPRDRGKGVHRRARDRRNLPGNPWSLLAAPHEEVRGLQRLQRPRGRRQEVPPVVPARRQGPGDRDAPAGAG